MNDTEEPDPFGDINEAVGEAWEAETTPYEHVREVISHVYDPQSVDAIAEEARTSPKTARKHLTALADEGFVTTEPGEHGGTHFRRSSKSLVVEQAATILDNLTIDELVDRIEGVRNELTNFQTEYGVESPEALTVEQTNQALSKGASRAEQIDRETLKKWQTTRRNLAFANAALSVANAERFVDDDTRPTGGATVSQ